MHTANPMGGEGAEDRQVRSAGKLSKIAVGQHIAYVLSTRPPPKAAARRAESVKRRPSRGQAKRRSSSANTEHVRTAGSASIWIGVHLGEEGKEVFGDDPAPHGLRPALEQVAAKRTLCFQLRDGVMPHTAVRQLDKAGWTWRHEEIEVAVRVVQQLTEERSRIWAAALSELNNRLCRETEERLKLSGPRPDLTPWR